MATLCIVKDSVEAMLKATVNTAAIAVGNEV